MLGSGDDNGGCRRPNPLGSGEGGGRGWNAADGWSHLTMDGYMVVVVDGNASIYIVDGDGEMNTVNAKFLDSVDS